MVLKQKFLSIIESQGVELTPEVAALIGMLHTADEELIFLSCLNAVGVDNWSGYEMAQEMRDESGTFE